MYPLSPAALRELRTSHGIAVRVEVWTGGGIQGNLHVLDGDVTVDAGSQVRRTLTLTTPGSDISWALLEPVGTELKVFRGIRFAAGRTEWIPLGVFVLDEESRSYDTAGTISVTAPDRWSKIQRARFERIRQTSGNAVISLISLAQEVLPDVTVVQTGSFPYRAARARWPDDRGAAMTALARAASADVSFDPLGQLRIRPAPVLAGRQPDWRVDAGASGVQLSASRSRSRAKTYNVVVVAPAAVDGTPPFAAVTVEDRDPTSPTYAGGLFGRVPYFFTSPLIGGVHQARVAGYTILDRVRAVGAQLQLTAVCNPALEDGDCIGAVLPRKRGQSVLMERHLVESCNIPLTAGGTQTIGTRSTQPDDAEDGGLEPGNITWADLIASAFTWTTVGDRYADWNGVYTDTRIGGS